MPNAPITAAPTSARWVQSINAPVIAALKHPWVESIVRLSAVEDALGALHPLLSLTQVRARVVKVVDETATAKTFVLQPNALWEGARSGQFVRVSLSLRSIAGDALVIEVISVVRDCQYVVFSVRVNFT